MNNANMTIETTIYKFNELSDSAKERARDWYRQGDAFSFQSDYIIEDAKTIGALFGLEIDNVYYSGFCSQGDGASFTGCYRYKSGGLKAVKDYAPLDADLHSIVEALQAEQKRNFYQLSASISNRGYYQRSGTMQVETERDDGKAWTDNNSIQDALRSFADWIYRRLEEEYYYAHSDEYIDESIIANEYEFTEEGETA